MEDLEGAKRQAVLSQFGKVPAFFIENKGQTAKEAKYYFKGNDNVYFTDEGVVFQKIETRECGTKVKDPNVGAGLPRPYRDWDAEVVASKALAYKLEFLGARPTSPQARNGLKSTVNYLIGNDRAKWHTNIPTYQEIVYPGLYPSHSEQNQSLRGALAPCQSRRDCFAEFTLSDETRFFATLRMTVSEGFRMTKR